MKSISLLPAFLSLIYSREIHCLQKPQKIRLSAIVNQLPPQLYVTTLTINGNKSGVHFPWALQAKLSGYYKLRFSSSMVLWVMKINMQFC